jgi:hypothetical protein
MRLICGLRINTIKSVKPIKPQSKMSDVDREYWRKYAEYLLSRNVSGRAAEACIRHAQRFAYGLKPVKLRDVDRGMSCECTSMN